MLFKHLDGQEIWDEREKRRSKQTMIRAEVGVILVVNTHRIFT